MTSSEGTRTMPSIASVLWVIALLLAIVALLHYLGWSV